MSIKETYDYYAKEGYLKAIPYGNLTLYNYTDACVRSGNWNYHTMTARGLILAQDGKIVGYPFRKFFNLGEGEANTLNNLPKETPELSEKYDGSMIVAFRNPETKKWQAVTRGCWDNVQTQFANRWLEVNGHKLSCEYTYLFELVAPWNRIVVKYAKEDMILIGVVHTESGQDWSYRDVREFALSKGITPVYFETRPIDSLKLDDPLVVNQEGFVARFSNGFRVKLKYDQYKILHKIVTGLSQKGIWEMLASGGTLDLKNVPDEFLGWFNEEKLKFQQAYRKIEKEAREVFDTTPKFPDRKSYAENFLKFGKVSAVLFAMLDNKSYSGQIWKMMKPSGGKVWKEDEN